MNQEKKEQSALLTEFYQVVSAQIDQQLPTDVIHEDAGLCWNLLRWAARVKHLTQEKCNDLFQEMEEQFMDAGLSYLFPFNKAEGSYHDECASSAILQNPARIQWVKDHAAI